MNINRIRRGADILEHPVLIRRGIFSTEDAGKVLGWSRKELNPLLFRLVKKGKLVRIKRALFCIQSAGTKDSKNGYPHNWYLIAKALAENKPYFVSYYSAMRLHGMTGESIQTIFVSCNKQLRIPQTLRIPIRFVTIPKTRFWGLEEKWVTNEEKVWTTGLERTFIDALDRLDLSGGITEVARGLWLVKKEISGSQLVNTAKRFDSSAVAKRLGFLMEILNLGSAKDREGLRRFALSSQSYVLFDPTLKKRGRYLHAWRLCLNQDPAEIKKNLMT